MDKLDTTLPATFKAMEDGVLLTATNESVFRLMSEIPDLLKNFLGVAHYLCVTRPALTREINKMMKEIAELKRVIL
ncbi:hypothetical protein A9168_11230 [Macellibacteroides sp. HH-ZS]|nr:hypothetical protein A9168_11230 [Macellibacteroides sp. HH-ZS]